MADAELTCPEHEKEGLRQPSPLSRLALTSEIGARPHNPHGSHDEEDHAASTRDSSQRSDTVR